MGTAFESAARQIVNQVRDWPVDARRELAEDILSTLPAHSEPRRKSLKDLLGLIPTDGHPPTDEECRAIIEEERLRKYSR
jgi:hypothetical protein